MTSFTLLDDGRPVAVLAVADGDRVRIPPAALREALGWELRPQGLCRGERCVPVRDRAALSDERGVDLAAFARAIDRPLALDAAERAAALGSSAAERTAQLASLEAPDFALPDLSGRVHRLSDQRGRKVLLLAYASWCGCREDLPAWQALYEELGAEGFVPITVALDQSPADARPYIERARPTHPSLIDTEHRVAELYHVVNVPTQIWIDEAGRIVRPNDTQFGTDTFTAFHGKRSGPYLAALRGWVREGRGVLDEDTARRHQLLPTPETQLARAHRALAWWLHRQGRTEAAERHFARAAELSPGDWTIRRGAMPIRGENPMGPKFFELAKEGVPRYPMEALPPDGPGAG
ncbi:MAG TPA: TlpA disulfide reductase family protein [Myxococcota bacterium]|nr:TlpA disulfide reductase family protein [Myxococcota bacterium]